VIVGEPEDIAAQRASVVMVELQHLIARALDGQHPTPPVGLLNPAFPWVRANSSVLAPIRYTCQQV
jgi:hypothetical protein